MENKIITAFDPGKTTGAASYILAGEIATIRTSHFEHFTLIDEIIQYSDIIIYEVPYRRPQTDLIVFEVKGVILERAYTLNKAIQPQQASIPEFINTAYSDFMKSKVVRKRLIHERDALCHLVYFLLKTNTLTIEKIEKILT